MASRATRIIVADANVFEESKGFEAASQVCAWSAYNRKCSKFVLQGISKMKALNAIRIFVYSHVRCLAGLRVPLFSPATDAELHSPARARDQLLPPIAQLSLSAHSLH